MDIDENTLYPLLRRLETQGLLDSTWRETIAGRSASTDSQRWGRRSWPPAGAVAGPRYDHPPYQLGGNRMTLVERYVRAVRDFLPRGQKDDITNELSDSMRPGSRTRRRHEVAR